MARRLIRRHRDAVIALAVIGAIVVSAQARAEGSKAAGWISADAAIYLEVTQPKQIVDRATSASFQKMLTAIPQYKRFLKGDQYKSFRAVVDVITGKLGTTWDKGLCDIAGGGIVFAVEGEPGKMPRVIVAVTPRDAAFLKRAVSTLVELARQDAADKKKPDPVKSAEYRGITGYSVDQLAYAIVDGTLVVTQGSDALKKVIDRAQDGAKAGQPITENADWKARRAAVGPDAFVWGLARLDTLRKLDAKKFTLPDKDGTAAPLTIFFGSWLEALRKAPWAAANLTWTDKKLGAELTVPTPAGGYPDSLKGFVVPKKAGAAAQISPPGTIANLSLWRDWAPIWEARSELLSPESAQGLAQFDTVAGQFFGGREFASVLGSIAPEWRLIVASQNYEEMKPVPDVKYPAFALVFGIKPEDEELGQQWKVTFQSFIGLVNLGSAQNKSPTLELGSETVEGVTISTSKFMVPKASATDEKEPVHYRHNFSPSIAHAGNFVIISSSLGLAREIVKSVKRPAKPLDATLLVEADGPELVKLLDLNRKQLVMQNMLNNGQNKTQAEEEVGTLMQLLRYLGHGRLSVQDGADSVRLALDFALVP